MGVLLREVEDDSEERRYVVMETLGMWRENVW